MLGLSAIAETPLDALPSSGDIQLNITGVSATTSVGVVSQTESVVLTKVTATGSAASTGPPTRVYYLSGASSTANPGVPQAAPHIPAPGNSITGSAGSVTKEWSVVVPGDTVTSSGGTPIGAPRVPITGVSATGSTGVIHYSVPLTSVSILSTPGTVSLTAFLSGVTATGSTNSTHLSPGTAAEISKQNGGGLGIYASLSLLGYDITASQVDGMQVLIGNVGYAALPPSLTGVSSSTQEKNVIPVTAPGITKVSSTASVDTTGVIVRVGLTGNTSTGTAVSPGHTVVVSTMTGAASTIGQGNSIATHLDQATAVTANTSAKSIASVNRSSLLSGISAHGSAFYVGDGETIIPHAVTSVTSVSPPTSAISHPITRVSATTSVSTHIAPIISGHPSGNVISNHITSPSGGQPLTDVYCQSHPGKVSGGQIPGSVTGITTANTFKYSLVLSGEGTVLGYWSVSLLGIEDFPTSFSGKVGATAQSSLGTLYPSTDDNVPIAGVHATTSVTSFTKSVSGYPLAITSNISAGRMGVEYGLASQVISSSPGVVTPDITKGITGLNLTAPIGEIKHYVYLSGVSLVSSANSVEYSQKIFGVGTEGLVGNLKPSVSVQPPSMVTVARLNPLVRYAEFGISGNSTTVTTDTLQQGISFNLPAYTINVTESPFAEFRVAHLASGNQTLLNPGVLHSHSDGVKTLVGVSSSVINGNLLEGQVERLSGLWLSSSVGSVTPVVDLQMYNLNLTTLPRGVVPSQVTGFTGVEILSSVDTFKASTSHLYLKGFTLTADTVTLQKKISLGISETTATTNEGILLGNTIIHPTAQLLNASLATLDPSTVVRTVGVIGSTNPVFASIEGIISSMKLGTMNTWNVGHWMGQRNTAGSRNQVNIIKTKQNTSTTTSKVQVSAPTANDNNTTQLTAMDNSQASVLVDKPTNGNYNGIQSNDISGSNRTVTNNGTRSSS